MKLRIATIADMIIQDTSGKISLIGMYPGDIRVTSLPSRFPLALYLEFEAIEPSQPIDLEFFLGRKRFAMGKIDVSQAIDGQSGVGIIPRMILNVKKPCVLSVATIIGGRRRTIIRKPISLNDDVIAESEP